MKKTFSHKSLLLVLVLLFYQMFAPIGYSFVSAASSILPPSNLTALKVTPDDIKLTWDSVYGATGYNVSEIKDGQIVFLGKVTTNSYNLNNLAEGSYQYIVSTLSMDGESGPSAPVSVDIVYPEMVAPDSLTQSIKNGNDIVLNWTASQYAEKYNVYQISADGQKTLISSPTARTYTISNASEGKSTYAVSSENSLYGESPLSTQMDVDVIYPIMKAPSNFTYTVTNGNDVTLTWGSVQYATNYKIYQIINGEKVLENTVTGTSVKLTNVAAGDHVYEIHSNSDRFGESADGTSLSVSVGTITMTAPSNLTYKLQNANDIVLTWDSVPYATSYKVYQIINGEKVLKNTVTSTTVTFAKMPAGAYEYMVYSYSDRFGESADGSKVSLTIDSVTMVAPSNFTYKIQNGNDIVLNWEGTSNTDSYKIYQIVNGQKVLKSTVTGTSVTYTNMPEGDYSYEVHSYSTRFGESEAGSTLSVSLVYPIMDPPANVIQTIKSASDFTLSWDASPYATSYKVYQIVDGQKVLKSTVSSTYVTYTKMPPGEYIYEVYSYSSRFGESAKGTQQTVTLNGLMMQPPTNLTYSITNGNDITLKWTGVQNANSYRIYQVIAGEKILQKTVTGTSALFTNMPAGDYTYEVHSVSTLYGESSDAANVTFSLVYPTMEAPTNVTAKVQNGNDVLLSWGTVPYANSYKIYELVAGEKVFVKSVTTLSTTLSNVLSGEHTYIIHSVSSRFGESPIGSEVTITIAQTIMQAPENLTYTIVNGNDISLKWNLSTYATGYKIYQIIDGLQVLVKTVTGTSVTFANMPEGDYKYEIHSYSDRFGESMVGSEVSFTLTHPVMQAPENLTYTIANGNDIVLKWNSANYANSYNVYRVIDGKQELVKTVTGTSVTFTNMPEGDYKYEVHSVSSRFGESVLGSELSLTLVHPIMQAPDKLTYSITNGNDIVLKWNAATYANSYNVYRVIDGKQELIKTVTGTSVTFTNMPEGDYTYEVHSYSSRFDESPKGSSINLTLTWPIVQPPELTGSVFNANNIALTWPKVTWANEYRVYQITNNERKLIYKGTALSYKVYNLTEETHSFEVTAYSTRFGESVPSNRITENIIYPVMEPPTASLQLADDTSAKISWNFITYANGYNIYEMIDGKPVLVAEKINNLSYLISNLSYANHEYYVTSYSNSFGESEPSKIVLAKLIFDTEAPVTTSNASKDWGNQDQIINLTATDNETGVEKTYYSLDGGDFVEGSSIAVNGEGIHSISFYSVDKVGNTEKVQTIEVKIDKIAPITTSDAPEQWSNKDVTVNLTSKDEQSGVDKTFYSINGSEYVEGSYFVVDQEGVNSISFYSVDQAGNKEDIQTAEVKIDKTVPKTTSDAPETWSSNDVTVNLTATDKQSGVDKTFYSINESKYQEGKTFTIQEEGIYKVSYYTVDAAGNVETAQMVEIKIDKTAPEVSMNLDSEYALGSNLLLLYTAEDNLSGVVSEKMTILGPNENSGKEVDNGSSITLDKPGVYTVTIVATNGAGLTTKIEKQFVVYIPATIEVTPKVIKGNKGIFTVRVDLPDGFNSLGFDLDTAKLNGVHALTSNKGYYNQAKIGQFQFERSDFTWSSAEQVLTFRGYVDGYLVVGQTTVKVQK